MENVLGLFARKAQPKVKLKWVLVLLAPRYGSQPERFDIKTFYKNEGGCMSEQGLRSDAYCKMCK